MLDAWPPNGLPPATSPNGCLGGGADGGPPIPAAPPAPSGKNGSLAAGGMPPVPCGADVAPPPIGGGAVTDSAGTSISAWHFGQRAFFPAAVSGTRRS